VRFRAQAWMYLFWLLDGHVEKRFRPDSKCSPQRTNEKSMFSVPSILKMETWNTRLDWCPLKWRDDFNCTLDTKSIDLSSGQLEMCIGPRPRIYKRELIQQCKDRETRTVYMVGFWISFTGWPQLRVNQLIMTCNEHDSEVLAEVTVVLRPNVHRVSPVT
jgi:hypothetical protein